MPWRRLGWLNPRVLAWVSVLFGVIAILKGIRPPGRWAATQLQLDYSFGFTRRGLLGSAARAVGLDTGNYETVAWLSFGLLVLFVTLLVAVCVRLKLYARPDTAIMATLLWASFAFTYLIHLVGYADIAQLCLVMAVLLSPMRFRLPVLSGATVLGILIHEAWLTLFLPVCLLPFALDAIRKSQSIPQLAIHLAPVMSVACLSVLVVLLITINPSWNEEQLATNWQLMETRVDFPMRGDFRDVMNRSLTDNFEFTKWTWATDRPFRHRMYGIALVFWPVLALLAFTIWRALNVSFSGHARLFARTFAFGAFASPMVMMFIGIDIERWHAITTLDGYLVLAIVSQGTTTPSDPTRVGIASGLALLLAGFNLYASTTYFDGYAPYVGLGEMIRPMSEWPLIQR